MTTWLFPDVADLLCDLVVPDLFPVDHTGLLTPPDLADVLPFARFACIGGADDRLTDSSTIDVDIFTGESIRAAMLLAEQTRQFLTADGGHVVDGVVIDRIYTNTRPRRLPYSTPGVFRVFTSYRATARRTAADD